MKLLHLKSFAILSILLAASPNSNATNAGDQTETQKVKIDDISLTVPKSWKKSQPTSRLRKAQFLLPGEKNSNVKTEFVVYFFGGAGGGVDANLKRWIGQFSAKGRSSKMFSGVSSQGKYWLVDISGTYQKPIGPPIRGKKVAVPNARMLAVILEVKGKGNYFFKLGGSQKTIDKAAKAFRASFGGDSEKEKPYKLE